MLKEVDLKADSSDGLTDYIREQIHSSGTFERHKQQKAEEEKKQKQQPDTGSVGAGNAADSYTPRQSRDYDEGEIQVKPYKPVRPAPEAEGETVVEAETTTDHLQQSEKKPQDI